MKMLECVKMLMKVNGVTQLQLAKWRGTSQSAIGMLLTRDDIKSDKAVELLDYLGYEVIVREKQQGLRRQDEILIDEDTDYSPEKIMLMKFKEENERIDEKKYEEWDRLLDRGYWRGMRISDLQEFFNMDNRTVHKYFDGYFRQKRVPVKYVKQIMRDNKL